MEDSRYCLIQVSAVGTVVVGVGGSIAVRPDTVGGGSVGPESVVSVVGVAQTVVAQSAVVSISISLGLSISGPLAEVPVGTIGVGGSIAVRADAVVEDRGSGVGPESVVSVVGVAQTVVAQSAVVSISISLGLSISRPLAEMPVGAIGVGGSIAVRPDTVVGGGSV